MKKYAIRENGLELATIEAESAEQALELVDAPKASDHSWESTIWVDWHAVNVEDENDSGWRTYQFDPAPPDCVEGHKHDWRVHESTMGDGGVVFSDRCKHCGGVRHRDTLAQNLADGSSERTSIWYGEATETAGEE